MSLKFLENMTPCVANDFSQIETIRDYERRFIVQHIVDTVYIEYTYETDQLYCDAFYQDYLGFEINNSCAHDFSWVYGVIYKPHISMVLELLNLTKIKTSCSRQATIKILASSGEFEWFRVTAVCYVGETGNKKLLAITASNVDKEMRAEKMLEFLAERDALTMVPNKFTFMEKTRKLLRKVNGREYVVVRMDIEQFSILNQIFGQSEGDNLLRYLAVKIQEYVETEGNGVYCRLESDVFCMCIPYIPGTLEKLEKYLDSTLKQYPLRFDFHISFGYYVISEPLLPVETMIDRAFVAQKTIKGNVIKKSAYYDEALHKKELARQKISSEMIEALALGQFQIFLQPKCNMQTGKIVGAEELIRWMHPESGMISPDDFIPIFEKTGFITRLDQYVLTECCKTIRRWIDTGVEVLPISVNISRIDIYNPELFDQIVKIVDEYSVPHSAIEFELTESSIITDNWQMISLIRKFNEQGFRVLMDDFGSGYSSLNSFKDMAVDVIKIDLKFLPVCREDVRACAILKFVVEMAINLGVDVIVEGIETQEQVDYMLEMGCQTAQGFYFYQPMPIVQYEKILAESLI